jgi:hypothetical protein
MLVGLLTPKKEAESRPCDELKISHGVFLEFTTILENTQVREALQNLIGIDKTLDLASLKS